MLKVIDLKGNPYPAQAVVNRKQIVNGEQTLSLSFSVSEINMDFLPDLSFNWLAEFDQEQYTLINPSTEAIVKRKSITAILKFFTDFGSMYLQDEVEDKSTTAIQAYTENFVGTGKRFHLVGSFSANTLSYSKNESRLERFHYLNKRYKAEFIVRGDDVYLYNRIGSDKPDVRIDEDLNVKSATVDIDSENFFTFCKCYYDLEKNEDGESGENYRQEYVWEDENLIELYGFIEGPALYQGNIRHEDTMIEFARDTQRESIKVSHSVDLVDLQRQGYEEFAFLIGDTIRLSLSSINTTVDIRIVDMDETWVENDLGEWERTDLKLTLGNVSAVQSYKSSQSDVFQTLEDWIAHRKPIPFDMVSPLLQRASDIVLGDTDSVMDYRKDRLTGWHSKNEGNNVTLNVNGLVFYHNGVPTTGATYEGIVAESIVGNSIIGVNLSSQNGEGYFHVNGHDAEFYDLANGRTVSISPDGIYGWNAMGDMRFQADSLLVASAAIGTSNYNVYLAPMDGGEARVVRHSDIPSDGLVGSYNYQPLRAEGFYGNYLNTNPSAPLNHMYIRTLSGMEVRLTRNETTDHYQDLRAADIHANSLSNNAVFGESSQLYLKPKNDGEVRVTEVGSTSIYRPVRARSFIAENSLGILNNYAGGLYIGTGGYELRITNNEGYNSGNTHYQTVRAAKFVENSSEKDKKNIMPFSKSALEILDQSVIYSYEKDGTSGEEIGFVLERETPDILKYGEGIDGYSHRSINTKAIQELSEEVNKLKELINQ